MPVTTTLPDLICRFQDDPPSTSNGVLGVISHGYGSEPPSLHNGFPALPIAVPDTAATGRVEVWRSSRDVVSGFHDELVYAHDGRYLFCGGRIRHDAAYAATTKNAYLRAFELLDRLGYPEIARVWNIVGGITGQAAEQVATDRYGEFCQARAQVFKQRGLTVKDIPAATGIGGHDDHTTIYFLATRSREVIRIENPRQIPAYEYPERYGPEAPCFARATYVAAEGDSRFADLFISGTASILGHRTVHEGDIERQTRTTLENIAELVSGKNLRNHGIDAELTLHDLDCVKVYIKRPQDVETVRQICSAALGPKSEVVYVIADICREDLLVEIEGFTSVARPDIETVN
ncbi:reactive intermediate/imine deaminase [Planomonospora sp. ID67723]|uniref:FkbO/Hyg5 family chorismatase n=1 Tax=Planomonospora sp. ID67723 TaxID=2738134 RepID=UPI0018C366F1|nr:FkbO/Hyg5 family chorismatase [Planomonospora sp. ID67723]MBG0831968.1 reactive intermediate/imine deaminase [Planomonospora sp. ID67723]